jgi:hypothetical protein
MSSIVLQLQQESLDRSVSVTDLLRKSLVVSRKLKLREFEAWINAELIGYGSQDEVPLYRKVKGSVKFFNPYRGWCPIVVKDPIQGEHLSTRNLTQTIAELENLKNDKDATFFHVPFSQETERRICKSLNAGFETNISLFIPQTEIVKIVEEVRNIILNWSLKLEEDGVLGEGMTFTPQESQSAKSTPQAVNNFYGPVHNPQIQQFNETAVQVHSQPPDIEALSKFVDSLDKSIQELMLSAEQEFELRAEVETIKSQLASPKPKTTILSECGISIRSILEKAGGTAVGSLLAKLTKTVF